MPKSAADLRRIFKESGMVMVTFLIASLATIVGALLGFFLLDLGDIGAKVAGVYTGGYIGGAVNFLAVSKAVQMTDSQFSVAISASSVVSMLALMFLIAIPSIRWIVEKVPSKMLDNISDDEKSEMLEQGLPHLRLTHITGGLALSFLICAVSQAIGDAFEMSHYNILFITLVTLVVANIVPEVLRNLEGDTIPSWTPGPPCRPSMPPLPGTATPRSGPAPK